MLEGTHIFVWGGMWKVGTTGTTKNKSGRDREGGGQKPLRMYSIRLRKTEDE
jgi:hypothetical protein